MIGRVVNVFVNTSRVYSTPTLDQNVMERQRGPQGLLRLLSDSIFEKRTQGMSQGAEHIPTENQISAVVDGSEQSSAYLEAHSPEEYVEEEVSEEHQPAHFMLHECPGTYAFPPYLGTAQEALQFWKDEAEVSDDEIVRFLRNHNKVRKEGIQFFLKNEVQSRIEEWKQSNPKKKLESKGTYEEKVHTEWFRLEKDSELLEAAELLVEAHVPLIHAHDVRHIMLAIKMYYWGPQPDQHLDQAELTRGLTLQLTHGILTVDEVVQMYGYKTHSDLISMGKDTWYLTPTYTLANELSTLIDTLEQSMSDQADVIRACTEDVEQRILDLQTAIYAGQQ